MNELSSNPRPISSRAVAASLLFWIVFSAVAIALRGVRWDETYEWAQVLIGRIEYPPHHPINRFIWSAYTLQHYATAALLYVIDDSYIVNGFRNGLVLIFGIAAIFLWTAHLTQRLAWAFAATALALFNVLTPFETTYPLRLWPYCFSDGPIGLGWALVTLYLVLTQRWRAGFFMLAAMPTIHIGQMPPVFVTSVLFTFVQYRTGHAAAIRRALPFAAAGLALCIALVITIAINRVAAPASGPYYATGDAAAIWSNYKEIWYHTTIRGGLPDFLHSHIAAIMALLLPFPYAWRALVQRRYADPWLWLFIFAANTTGAVWIAMWLHTVLGPDVPFIVIGWMPYRLANQLPFLILAMATGILATDARSRMPGAALLAAGLFVSALHPLLPRLIGDAMFDRYLADGAWILYLLVGAAIATLARGLTPDGPVPFAWGVLVFAGVFVLAGLHQFATAALAFGFIACHILARLPSLRFADEILAALAATGILVIGALEYLHRDSPPEKGFDVKLEITPFDYAVREHFAERNITNELILVDNFSAFMQARIDQPVMATWMLDSFIIYTPEFAPPIQKIYREIYGIRFGESLDDRRPQQPETWQTRWASRTVAEWRALGTAYDVEYAIAPSHLELAIEPVLEAEGLRLYRIR